MNKIITRVFILARRCIYMALFAGDALIMHRATLVTIFCYHAIADDDWRFGVGFETFKRQIDYLLARRKPVTLRDIEAHIRGEAIIKEPSFALTFDDGYRDILSVRDYISRCGIKPALFVLSDRAHADRKELGTSREFLSVGDIRMLREDGWDVGCHSATHRAFVDLDDATIRQEIAGAKVSLEKELGFPIRYFAYPRGRYSKRVLKAVKDAGFSLGLSMNDSFINKETNPFVVPRTGVDRTHSFTEFKAVSTTLAIRCRGLIKWIFREKAL